MSSEPIYGTADIAELLCVSRAAVSNYLRRHDDTPAEDYVTTDGRLYWNAAGAQRWRDWQASRLESRALSARRRIDRTASRLAHIEQRLRDVLDPDDISMS